MKTFSSYAPNSKSNYRDERGHQRTATQDSAMSSASAKEKFQQGLRKKAKREHKIEKRAHRRMNSVRTQVEQVQKMVDKFDTGNKGFLSTLEIKRFLKDFGVKKDVMAKAVSTIKRDVRGRSKKSQLVSWVINEAPRHDWGRWKQIQGFSNIVANLASRTDRDGHSPRKDDAPAQAAPALRAQRPSGTDHEAGWRSLLPDQLGTRLQFYTYLMEEESKSGNAQALGELRNKIRIIEKLMYEKGLDPAQYAKAPAYSKLASYKSAGIIKSSLSGLKGREVKDIIKKLRLQVAPQGGLYAEMYRSNDTVFLPNQPRSSGTLGNSAHYLLEAASRCCWHRTTSDQTWAFHRGCEVEMFLLDVASPIPTLSTARLGDVLSRNQARPQIQVRAGLYVAAELSSRTDYALLSIHNFPAQDMSGCEMPACNDLLRKTQVLPQHRELIRRLAHDGT